MPRGAFILYVALFLAALLLYLPPYKKSFIGDDYLQLGYIAPFVENPLQGLQVFHPFWSEWYFRPLQNIWFLFCRITFGLNPFGFYFLQGLWHLLAASALLALAKRFALSTRGTIVALALFLIYSHHHDVVAWISSIATIMVTTFSLLAVVAYVHYLRQAEKRRWLLACAILTLLALLSHEEAILLTPILVLVRHLFAPGARIVRSERIIAGFLIALTALWGGIHFFRPNATILLADQISTEWLLALNPQRLAHFVVTVAGRWLLLSKTVYGSAILSTWLNVNLLLYAGATVILGALVYYFWRGGRIVRLGVAWAILHIGFVYVALWQQKPELLAGRHLYSSWAFVSLILGAGFTRYEENATATARRVAVSLLLVLLAINTALLGEDQRVWHEHARQVADVEMQMKVLIPEVTAGTKIFAYRFVLQPSFTPAAAAVWYDEPGISGGSLAKLQTAGAVDNQTYVLDFFNGRLYNAVPGLQSHAVSSVLWQPNQATVSVAPASAEDPGAYQLLQSVSDGHRRKLAISVSPSSQGWLSLHYQIAPGAGTHLATEFLGEEGASFRIRLQDNTGAEWITYHHVVQEEEDVWLPVLIPLTADGASIASSVILEAQGPSNSQLFWSLPRLVRD